MSTILLLVTIFGNILKNRSNYDESGFLPMHFISLSSGNCSVNSEDP